MMEKEADEFKSLLEEQNNLHKNFKSAETELYAKDVQVKQKALNLQRKIYTVSYSGVIVVFSSADKFDEFEEELVKRSLDDLVPCRFFTVRTGSFLPHIIKYRNAEVQNKDLCNIDKMTVDALLSIFYKKKSDGTDDDEESEEEEDKVPTNENNE